MVRALLRHRDLRGARVLEIGPGSGGDAVALARLGARVTAIDYSRESLPLVRRAAERAGVSIDVVHGDAFQPPFADGTFDVVCHQGLLEHFRDPRPLLAANARLLAPGGDLLVDVPQRWHPYTVLKHGLMAVDRWFAGWETEFSIRQLRDLIAATGLDVIDEYGSWMVPNLFYRAARRGLADAGVTTLPMYPAGPRWLRTARAEVRVRALATRLPLHTGACIGVVARRPVNPATA
jgi:SAM-dependent methyltransferase